MPMERWKILIENVLPLFEKTKNKGKMDNIIQQQIFHHISSHYSCFPLYGTKFIENPKKPRVQGWTNGSMKWLEFKNFNTDMIGLCTGLFNRLIVFDIDDIKIFLQVKFYFDLSIPDNNIVKTGRGWHFYCLYSDDGNLYKRRCLRGLGFDILADKSFVTALGSNHPNGNYYRLVKCLNHLIIPPKWMLACSLENSNDKLYFVLSELNRIRNAEVSNAEEKKIIVPKFILDDLVTKFLAIYPEYEPFMHQFSGYRKFMESKMNQKKLTINPFEQEQNSQIEIQESPKSILIENPYQGQPEILKTETKDLLNQSPPVTKRSEAINTALLQLFNTDLPSEQSIQIISSSPVGDKLRQVGDKLITHEQKSSNDFIIRNPPKKPKINIEHESYEIMRQQYYVKDNNGILYCKAKRSANIIEYINVSSESFYGFICNLLIMKYKRSIPLTKFKQILIVFTENIKLTTPTIPSISRFYQENDKIIYDLGREDYQCIEINPNVVKQILHPEMILERSELTLPINEIDLSQKGIDNINLFWDLCQIDSIHQRHFLNIVILSYLFNNINSPILYFYGQHGSGKTRLALAIKSIFDPWNEGAVLPTKLDNFRLLLNQSGIGFIDNFSELKSDFLNDLCMSYSGGTVFSRELFKDKKGIKYSIRCPMILASINIPKKLPEDFISRTAFIKVNNKNNRLPEIELNKNLYSLYPKIRGEMFNLASQILPLLNNYKPTNLSRHADLDQIGQAYCDLFKTSLSYINIFQQINIDSAFSVVDDEPSIRNFIKIVTDNKFITFTMSEMCKIMYEDANINLLVSDSKLGKDLKDYSMVLHQLHIKLYSGDKLSGGARPYVAFVDDGQSIPDGIDIDELQNSPKYVTDIYLLYHKTEIGLLLDDMINKINI